MRKRAVSLRAMRNDALALARRRKGDTTHAMLSVLLAELNWDIAKGANHDG